VYVSVFVCGMLKPPRPQRVDFPLFLDLMRDERLSAVSRDIVKAECIINSGIAARRV
jgi:hypothetical protein